MRQSLNRYPMGTHLGVRMGQITSHFWSPLEFDCARAPKTSPQPSHFATSLRLRTFASRFSFSGSQQVLTGACASAGWQLAAPSSGLPFAPAPVEAGRTQSPRRVTCDPGSGPQGPKDFSGPEPRDLSLALQEHLFHAHLWMPPTGAQPVPCACLQARLLTTVLGHRRGPRLRL